LALAVTSCARLGRECVLRGGALNTTSPHAFEVAFLATAAAAYSVAVDLDSLPLAGSPYFLRVAPAELSVPASGLRGSGALGGVVGRPAPLTIVARDAYGNPLSAGGASWAVRVDYDDGAQAEVEAADADDGTYRADYLAARAAGGGFLSVRGVTGAGLEHVSGSPCRLAFVADDGLVAIPTYTTLTGSVAGLVAGTPAPFVVTLRDQNGFDRPASGDGLVSARLALLAAASGGGGARAGNASLLLPVNVTNLGDGRYAGALAATVAGGYLLTVTLSGEHIRGSPWPVRVLPAASSPKKSRLAPSSAGDLSAIAGSPRSMVLTCLDAYANLQVAPPPFPPPPALRRAALNAARSVRRAASGRGRWCRAALGERPGPVVLAV
jgi:hypothetical protein